MSNGGGVRRIDVRAWVLWVAALAVIAMTARNPLYSIALILIARIVGARCGSPDNPGTGLPIFRIGMAVLIFSTLFNGLSVHVGDTVLLRLPSRIPWIGGPITLEAAVYGLGTGLLLLSLLVIFGAFNSVVPSSDLVRLTPGAFRDLGVVVLIAVTYIPETKLQLQRIREAQAIRGHRFTKVRDWQPVIIPLLIGGLERAMGLAEAMVARGFGATSDVRQPLYIQLGLAAGLLFGLTGWILTFWTPWLGWLLLGIGLITVVALMTHLGRSSPSTQYQSRKWTSQESLTVAGCTAALAMTFLPLPFVDRATLLYSPYPSLSFPEFDLVIGMALICLLVPAIVTLVE